MAAYLATFIASTRSTIAATWTDCPAAGIIDTLEAATIESLTARDEDGKLPFAALDWALRENTWGVNTRLLEGELRVYYVCRDTVDLPTLIGKLESLRDALYGAVPTGGQIIGLPSVSWSLDLPLNSLFARNQRPFRCGMVSARVVCGEVV